MILLFFILMQKIVLCLIMDSFSKSTVQHRTHDNFFIRPKLIFLSNHHYVSCYVTTFGLLGSIKVVLKVKYIRNIYFRLLIFYYVFFSKEEKY